MGRIAVVEKFERVVDPLAPNEFIDELTVDPGGGALLTVPYLAPSGDDSPPRGGDYVALVRIPGESKEVAVACADPLDRGIANEGEKRIYARDSFGLAIAEIHIKADGSLLLRVLDPIDPTRTTALGEIKMEASGKVDINGHLTIEAI